MACLQTYRRLRQYLISDLLGVDNGQHLRTTLMAVCNLARESALKADPDQPMRKICLLGSPAIHPVIRDLGFEPDHHYKYPLQVSILDPAMSRDDIAVDRWYVTAND